MRYGRITFQFPTLTAAQNYLGGLSATVQTLSVLSVDPIDGTKTLPFSTQQKAIDYVAGFSKTLVTGNTAWGVTIDDRSLAEAIDQATTVLNATAAQLIASGADAGLVSTWSAGVQATISGAASRAASDAIATNTYFASYSERGADNMAVVDFSSTPATNKSVFISAPGIPATALIRAWFGGNSTTDNDEISHLMAGVMMTLTAGVCSVGSGFRVHAYSTGGKATGQFQFNWRWI